MTQSTHFTYKDPESFEDALDQDEGLNGGSRSEATSSSWWIYALIGVVVVGGIIVLIVCLSGKKKKTNAQDFGVPTKGELTSEDTQKFVKMFYDLSEANLTQLNDFSTLDLSQNDLSKVFKLSADELTKRLDNIETACTKELALVKDAESVANRIKKNLTINTVTSVQDQVTDYLKKLKDAMGLLKPCVETARTLNTSRPKDPAHPTADETTAVTKLQTTLASEYTTFNDKVNAAAQMDRNGGVINKLFPTSPQ